MYSITNIVPVLALSSIAAALPQNTNFQPPSREVTEKVGDGNPHQWYKYTQVGTNHDCNGGSCEMGFTDIKSETLSFGADVSAAGWIGGGFAVSKTQESGDVPNCQPKSEQTAKTLCVWWRQAYTAYTVQDWTIGAVSRDSKVKKGNEYVMWSPNNDEVGSAFVCARDDECQNKGAWKWGEAYHSGTRSPPGGPKSYPFDKAWQ